MVKKKGVEKAQNIKYKDVAQAKRRKVWEPVPRQHSFKKLLKSIVSKFSTETILNQELHKVTQFMNQDIVLDDCSGKHNKE